MMMKRVGTEPDLQEEVDESGEDEPQIEDIVCDAQPRVRMVETALVVGLRIFVFNGAIAIH